MKATIFLVIIIGAILITSCTKFADEKKLIEYKLQAFRGTQIDLKIKFNEFEHIKTITYQDSLKHRLLWFSRDIKVVANNFDEFIYKSDSLINYNTHLIDSLNASKAELEELLYNFEHRMEEDKRNYYKNLTFNERVVIWEKTSTAESEIYSIKTRLGKLEIDVALAKDQQKNLTKYNSEKTTVIASLYKVNYTAFNPLLNTNQTFDTYYLINTNTGYVKRMEDYKKSEE